MPHEEKRLRDGTLSQYLSEDWLLQNLPDGWTYDCRVFNSDNPAAGAGFIIYDREDTTKSLFIPLSLLGKRA